MVYYRSSVSEVINTVMLYGFALMAGQHASHFMTSHGCLICNMRADQLAKEKVGNFSEYKILGITSVGSAGY